MMAEIAPARFTIWLLLLVTLIKGIIWSIFIPPWHAPDENNHFAYAQIIERFGILRPDPNTWQLAEIAVSKDAVQFQAVRYSFNRFLDLSERKNIAEQIARLNDPTVKRGYVYDDGVLFRSFLNFTYDHPPLYYLLAGAIQVELEDKSILVRILANRWLSVFIGMISVALAYRAGKEIWQNEAWACLLAVLVSFQPMMTFMTSVISDGALGIAMLSACTLVLLRVIHGGWTMWRASALAILLGIGLLARTSLIILIPVLVLLLIWNVKTSLREKRFTSREFAPIFSVIIIALFIAGWWYKRNGFDNSDTPINFLISGIAKFGSNWPRFFTSYDWFGSYNQILEMYWGNFGWLNTPLPQQLNLFLTGITLVGVWTTGWWLLRRIFSSGQTSQSRQTFMIFILGVQTIFLVIFYTYLDFQFSTIGGIYRPQGRYFLPAILGQMTWLAVGLVSPAPMQFRRAWMWLISLGMILLNVFSLFSVMTLRYYGARNLLLVADRAAVLQPTSPNSILVLCAIFFLLTGVLMLALWQVFENTATRSNYQYDFIHKVE